MSNRWVISDGRIVTQNIDDTSTVQNMPLGTIVRARDTNTTNNQGEGEFIYLKGVVSTVVGSMVDYDMIAAPPRSRRRRSARARWRSPCRRTSPRNSAGTRSAALPP
jgi:hypothetical protein